MSDGLDSSQVGEKKWGGKRAGAGRKPNRFVRPEIERHLRHNSRASIYRCLRRGKRLSRALMEAEARDVNIDALKGVDLDIVSKFETDAERTAALIFLSKQRKEQPKLRASYTRTLMHVLGAELQT